MCTYSRNQNKSIKSQYACPFLFVVPPPPSTNSLPVHTRNKNNYKHIVLSYTLFAIFWRNNLVSQRGEKKKRRRKKSTTYGCLLEKTPLSDSTVYGRSSIITTFLGPFSAPLRIIVSFILSDFYTASFPPLGPKRHFSSKAGTQGAHLDAASMSFSISRTIIIKDLETAIARCQITD